jgi:hypothetical protein
VSPSAAKDSSATPAKQGRIAQIRQGYQAIKSLDPKLGWWMLGAALLTAAVLIGLGFLIGGAWRFSLIVLAIPSALLAATIVMNRRGNKAMYTALDGQRGATGMALQGMGNRGWYTSQEPVAVDVNRGTKLSDMSGAAMVFRALGRPGIVLLGEGPDARVAKLLKAEEKKVARVAPGVPIHLWTVGDEEGQVPIRKIGSKLTRMRPQLSKAEVAVVNKRLKSLGGLRTGVPAGMDPTRARVDRKAMRGR